MGDDKVIWLKKVVITEPLVTIRKDGKICFNRSMSKQLKIGYAEFGISEDCSCLKIRDCNDGFKISNVRAVKNSYCKRLAKYLNQKEIALPAIFLMEYDKTSRMWVGKYEGDLVPEKNTPKGL